MQPKPFRTDHIEVITRTFFICLCFMAGVLAALFVTGMAI